MDVGILNFGGIRTSMPEGDVLLDDFVSMFPFKNYMCSWPSGGSACWSSSSPSLPGRVRDRRREVSRHRIDTLLVGGKPIDPKKTYGVATVDFLLDGGDGLSVGKNART